MEQRILGKTGLSVSVLGFGGAEIGYEDAEQQSVDRMLNRALDSGLNVIDTAECYGNSEEKIGAAVGHRRSDFHLFTKCGHASGLNFPDWDPRLIRQNIDRSLRRLRTDHVDLLQLHSCSADVLRQGDVIRELEDAKQGGKARFLGYSGDGEDALFAVNTGAFDTLQTSINLLDQECLELTLPPAAEREMGIIAKRSVANAVWKYSERPDEAYYHAYWDRLQEMQFKFLAERDVQESVGIALRFTLSTPGVTMALIGTKSEERLTQNLKLAEQTTLLPKLFEQLRSVWRQHARPDWSGQV